MFNIVEKSISWGDRKLTLQTGKIARQADGACVAQYGGTSVLATVVFAKEPKKDIEFFPLSVSYQDKHYSVGKIPGGFLRREGKPTDKEVLLSRLIDRPIRPLFNESFRNEVQIIISTLSYDGKTSVDSLSIVAASAALALSGAPVMGTIGAAKVGYIDGNYVLNPTSEQLQESKLDLMVAGTEEGVLMVESEAHELDEATMLKAVEFGHKSSQDIIKIIKELKAEAGKPDHVFEDLKTEEYKKLYSLVENFASEGLSKAFSEKDKVIRKEQISQIELASKEHAIAEGITEDELSLNFNKIFKEVEKKIVRGNILDNSQRIDGRKLNEVRQIASEVDAFERSHGSSIFTRGETQALVFTTLGTDSDEQIIDDIEGDNRERFMLHYNFPPYSVGETGRTGAPGRREIGHGKLAWRAINPVLPSKAEFPYCLRVVSEITESNGSSSMATVCGASLSLMSAGVPLKSSVSGIAMGLIKEGEKYAVLSDILGDEDHLGDMDFKVAGTKNGITALQMDIKITSITYEIMEVALSQAKEGRAHILSEMDKALSTPREEVNEHALKIKSLTISKDKIKDVIGAGGKVIKEISETNSVKIDISNDGLVKVYGNNIEGLNNAVSIIEGLTALPEVGKVYNGKIVKIIVSGAFVSLFPGTDGFLHISEVSEKRISDIRDVISEGQEIAVKLVSIDDKGRLKLSTKLD